MNKIYRKELTDLNTNFLIKMKHTILARIDQEKYIPKAYSHMLVDVLSELDYRRVS